ncbi:hypothetical protein [Glutamicibacter ardleyensis]|uniref:hypothetical protein n=1 Tax=Glutamicibacter ardleyensis TaxID=225894 RepID=UPI003FD685DC
MSRTEARVSLLNHQHQMGEAVSRTLNDFEGLMIDGNLTDTEGQFQVNFMSANEEQHLEDGLNRLEGEARERGFFELKIHPEALEDFDTPEESAGFLSLAGYEFDGDSYIKGLRDRPAIVEPEPEPTPEPKPEPEPEPKPEPEPEPEPEPSPATDGTLSERGIPAGQINEENYDGTVPVPDHLTQKYRKLIQDMEDPKGGEQGAVAYGALLGKRAEVLAGFDVTGEADRLKMETLKIRESVRNKLADTYGSTTKNMLDSRVTMVASGLNKIDGSLRTNNAKLRDAYRQTLSEVRPLGGIAKTGKRSQKKAIAYLNEATQFFPSEWVKMSDDHKYPLIPKMSSRRAHYIEKTWTADGLVANLTTNETSSFVDGQAGAVAISTHEFTHRMENVVPGLYQLEMQFRNRRTTQPNGRLEPLVGINSPRSKERGRVDHFTSRYMGRVYSFDGYTEIMSTGTQALFGGDFGGLTGMGRGSSADPDMRNFVLGVLGGHAVGKETPKTKE